MEEIAQQFRKELQALLDRYKDRLTTPQIMRAAQPVFTKTIGFKDNPERFENYKEINGLKVPAEVLEENFKQVDYTGHIPMRTMREVTKALKERHKLESSNFSNTGYEPGYEPNAFRGPNAICMQGPDGCCATYKNGWDSCKGCMNYRGGNR